MAKKSSSNDRKARLEAARTQQKAKERRTLLIIVAGVSALLLVLVGVITYAVVDARSQTLPNLGASRDAARCTDVTSDSGEGTGNHVGPGTSTPEQTTIDYDTVPPSHGPHFAQPALSDRRWYTGADRPPVEQLVHNLEHGYTILWYDAAAAESQTDLIEDVVARANRIPAAENKFLAVEWDSAYGELPEGTPWSLVHWAADAGQRMYCGELSGEVVSDFIDDHPAADTQEPGAA